MKIVTGFIMILLFGTNIYGQKSMGFLFRIVDNQCKVTAVIKNGPAEKTGIEQDDLIMSVDGVMLSGLSLEAVAKILKEAKDVCDIKLMRKGIDEVQKRTLIKADRNSYSNKCISGDCINGNGVFMDYDGNTFDGIFSNKKYINGKMTYITGEIYNGNYADNQPNGKGNMVFKNGNIYEGDFANGEPNGTGTYNFKSGVTHTGFFKAGKPNGTIKVVYQTQISYVEYKDGVKLSSDVIVKTTPTTTISNAKFETLTYKSGNKYEGYTLNGIPNGTGKLTLVNGEYYESEWINGNPGGKLKYSFINGNFYEGEFKDGNINGTGKMTYANGDYFDGQWIDGRIGNKGKYRFKNGSLYEGDYKDGKRHGNGKQIYANGDYFEGNWSDDKIGNKGKYSFKNGDIYEGEWKDGKQNGYGKRIYAIGDYFEGNWIDNKIGNKGKYVYENGDYYDGEWKDTYQNGYGKEYTKRTNSFKIGTWKDGKLLPKEVVASPKLNSTNLTSNETITILQKVLNGEFYKKEQLFYKLTNKRTDETIRYQIEFINEGNKLTFKYFQVNADDESATFVLSTSAIASANKYVNFYNKKTDAAADKEIVFMLSQALYKAAKTNNEIKIDLGNGIQNMTYNTSQIIFYSNGYLIQNDLKELIFRSDDRKSKLVILDYPICPLIVRIETPEYLLVLTGN